MLSTHRFAVSVVGAITLLCSLLLCGCGKPNNKGVLTDQNGTRQEGVWRDGKLYVVSGALVFPDGTKETGTWYADGSVCGGTIIWPDGRKYKGDWKISENAPELPDGPGE